MVSALDVPAMVAAHSDFLGTDDYVKFSAMYLKSHLNSLAKIHKDDKHRFVAQLRANAVNDDTGREWCQKVRDKMRISRLYHVSEPMMIIAAVASDKLDDDTRWTFEDLPSPTGFLIFEKSLPTSDIWGRTTTVGALSWHWVAGEGLDVEFWNDELDLRDDYTRSIRDSGNSDNYQLGRFELAHVALFGEDDPLGPVSPEGSELMSRYVAENEKPNEDRVKEGLFKCDFQRPNLSRILFSIFAMMDETISLHSVETDNRLARRHRQGKVRTPPMVTVIKLRNERHYGQREEGTGDWLTYCYVRDGHWRKQPYGPRTAPTYKKIWISPTMVGDPEKLPFHQSIKVTSLSR